MSTIEETRAPETPPTPTTRLMHDIAEEAPLSDPVRRRRVLTVLGAVVVVVALVVGGLRILGGFFGGDGQEKKNAAAIEKVQAEILPELRDLLTDRETFLAAERAYLPVMTVASRYNDQPARDRVPRFKTQIAELERVSGVLTGLRTSLRDVTPPPITSDAQGYLLSAVTTLQRDVTRNLGALRKAVKGEKIRLVAVNDDNALPSIRSMNKSLLFVLDAAQLPVKDFDLPGGTDAHPDDHSTLM